MQTTILFESEGSQAIKIPEQFRYDEDELIVQKIENIMIFIPKDELWDTFLDGTKDMSDDWYAEGREDFKVQERDW